LFSVGDIIDRGRLSYQCLEFLQLPFVHAVRGNHEDMLLNLYSNGAPSEDAFHYATSLNGLEWWREVGSERRVAILVALRALPLVFEVETVRGTIGIVHAEVPSDLNWQQFCALMEAGDVKTVNQALWGRSRIQKADGSGVLGVGRVFVGHTPQREGLCRYGNIYAVDTGAVFGAEGGQAGFHLTVANIVSGTASLGETRQVGLVNLPIAPGAGPFGNYSR
jgi:serine/threonine protein phosphatase 1